MKTSDVFKTTYGITLGFMCAKFTMSVCCGAIKKLCDIGIDKIEKNQKVSRKPYYTKSEKRYSLIESLDEGWINVQCETAKDLKDLVKWFDLLLVNYGCVSVNDLKEYVESGFTSFEYKDQAEGWTSKAYHIDRVTNIITFDIPIDISDLVFDPDKNVEDEEEKEDEVEDSE